jgi:hypothetical protein
MDDAAELERLQREDENLRAAVPIYERLRQAQAELERVKAALKWRTLEFNSAVSHRKRVEAELERVKTERDEMEKLMIRSHDFVARYDKALTALREIAENTPRFAPSPERIARDCLAEIEGEAHPKPPQRYPAERRR